MGGGNVRRGNCPGGDVWGIYLEENWLTPVTAAPPLSPSVVVLNHISSHFLIPLSDSSFLICTVTVPAQWLILDTTIAFTFNIKLTRCKNLCPKRTTWFIVVRKQNGVQLTAVLVARFRWTRQQWKSVAASVADGCRVNGTDAARPRHKHFLDGSADVEPGAVTVVVRTRGGMQNTVVTSTSKLKSSYDDVVSKSVCITPS